MKENSNNTDWDEVNREIFAAIPAEFPYCLDDGDYTVYSLPIKGKIPERYIESKPRRQYTEE